ncbi:glycine zipper 2TM domain-containing protein [Pleurocapsa sp. FMAR1]|uniref:glycine zipper 2TM domain-containing protein n=1 Tax=Pleurocapsa sp. FMAR1 TaxID=3040204 RepID=UPI0029C77374|nr:YMGG-like glycine zipper-containing protein [Pleurocapsa sp. FMAR1]
MNEENKNKERQEQKIPEVTQKSKHNALETGIGAVGGGVAGAAIGSKLIGGKTGAVVGAIAGAVVGGAMSDVVGEDLEQLEQKAMEVLGEAQGENEILAHYSWEQLQALSRPQT